MIKHKYEENKENVASGIKDMCVILQNAFDEFKTEHQTLQYFIQHGYLIMPQSVHISATLQPKRLKMHTSMGLTNQMLQIIPLKPLLIKILQLPNIFDTIIKNMRESKSSNVLTSIIDGKIWKRIEKQFAEKLVIPLLLYFDDFELITPLDLIVGYIKLPYIVLFLLFQTYIQVCLKISFCFSCIMRRIICS